MTRGAILLFFALVVLVAVSACGTYTPDKDPFKSDAPDALNHTSQGLYEIGIVDHITCELGQGLTQAKVLGVPWLIQWGTTVTQTITVEDQTGLSPGITAITPLKNIVFPFPASAGGNVVSPQSFSFSLGGTASVNGLRTETIQYTFRNSDILKYYSPLCLGDIHGVMIDGDLKIREFIYDKALIAASGLPSLVGSASSGWKIPPFNTFTEEITFVASYGASVTPTWHLARFSANTSSNLLIGQRTNTNDLIITLGPVKCPSPPGSPPPPPGQQCPQSGQVLLADAAMNQHQARVAANAIAVSITGQTH
jgi:hypothetical protein